MAERTASLAEAKAAAEPPPPPPVPPEGLEHLMALFVAEMDRDAARLDQIKGGDRTELAEFAHAIRGKAAMFGEDILFALLTLLETQAKVAEDGEIGETVARVIERVGQLRVYGAP